MKKRILKRAACVVILTGIVIGAIYGWKYYENEQRKKQNAYFTEDRLTANEMWIMVNLYHVKSTPVYPWEMDEDKWPDYSYYTIEPTEDTEKVATVLSYDLANELYSTEQEAIDLFKEYGFSKKNFMTAEWIMDNPKKAVKIMRLISDSRWYINEEKNVYPAYEKLTGETEDMSESTEDTVSNEDESEK